MPKEQIYSDGLTLREWNFAKLVIKGANKAAAYQSAFPTCKKNTTASVMACRLLKKTIVKHFIEKELAIGAAKTRRTVGEILREVEKIAFGDVKNHAKWSERGVDLIPSDEQDDTSALAGISETANGVRFRMHSKDVALRTLLEVHGVLRKEPEPDRDIHIHIHDIGVDGNGK